VEVTRKTQVICSCQPKRFLPSILPDPSCEPAVIAAWDCDCDPPRFSSPTLSLCQDDHDALNFIVVTNDMKRENYVRLITLKQIISKQVCASKLYISPSEGQPLIDSTPSSQFNPQLPKMPKDYIVRLVFDRKVGCMFQHSHFLFF
jgi:hypothetical protein